MEQLQLLPEFISNHLFLAGAFLVVLAMLVKSEFEHQTSRSFQIDPTQATRVMNNDDAVIIDVRSDAEFAKAHIKGAKHVAMADVEARLKSLTSNTDDAVLVYCNTGNISAKVSRMLIRNGYANVKSLKGGLAAWQEANLPVGTK